MILEKINSIEPKDPALNADELALINQVTPPEGGSKIWPA
jgi:hypothetical protein